mmetsp:Transcript_6899/g.6051  ORF Transcript_6899/g.6051 Transcript_6899/m.6051 type:complete len:154 (+) Transcript_6899:127-588(+)
MEVLYLVHNLFQNFNIYFLAFIFFNIVSMAASVLYANFYHRSYGNNLIVKGILVTFILTSVACYIIVFLMEAGDLINFMSISAQEIQESLVNIVLFVVPVLHCIFLGYIWYVRRKADQRSEESYSDAQNQLNPISQKYGKQVDDDETAYTRKK